MFPWVTFFYPLSQNQTQKSSAKITPPPLEMEAHLKENEFVC